MDGPPTPMNDAIPPDCVVARQSTDMIAVEDPHLADVLHFIHDHISEPFGTDRVTEAMSISRRQLETRFRRKLGCSPNDYLSRRRLERAKELIAASGRIKFHKMAMLRGFSSVEHMRLVFKRITGMTPLEYRKVEGRSHGRVEGDGHGRENDKDV